MFICMLFTLAEITFCISIPIKNSILVIRVINARLFQYKSTIFYQLHCSLILKQGGNWLFESIIQLRNGVFIQSVWLFSNFIVTKDTFCIFINFLWMPTSLITCFYILCAGRLAFIMNRL